MSIKHKLTFACNSFSRFALFEFDAVQNSLNVFKTVVKFFNTRGKFEDLTIVFCSLISLASFDR